MVSVSSNSEIKVWSLRKGCLVYTLYGHNGVINHATFSKQGDFFATGGADCSVLVWESAFCKKGKESVQGFGLCESGHRTDKRTLPTVE